MAMVTSTESPKITPGMQWWLTDKGLNMAVIALSIHERLALRLDEVERFTPLQRGFAFERFLHEMFGVFGLSPGGDQQ
jgi:hypothetical protein